MKNLSFFLLLFSFTFFLSFTSSAQCPVNGPGSLSSGNSGTYSTTAVAGASYFWSATGGLSISGSPSGSSATVTAGSTGGSVCVTVFRAGMMPCCNCTNVSIIPPCTPMQTLSIVQDEVPGQGCPGDIFTFDAIFTPTSVSPGTFTWQAFNGGFIVSGQGTSSVQIQTPPSGGMLVRVTFTSCDGSTISAITLATYEDKCGFFLQTEKEAGVPSNLMQAPVIAPNPFRESTELFLQVTESTQANVEIFNTQGKLIHTFQQGIDEGLNVLPIDLPADSGKGVLIYRITTPEGIMESGQMIRQ
ncbi:MAG: T9SS type A sorting domain-containing protein [Bacteroidota bacterium]